MRQNLKVRWLALTILLDFSLTGLALWLAYRLRLVFPAGVYLDDSLTFSTLDKPLLSPLALAPLVFLTWMLVFSALSVYNVKFVNNQYQQIYPIFAAVTGSVLMLAGLAYFFFPELSRFLFLYFYLFDLLLLIGWRQLVAWLLQNHPDLLWQPRYRVVVVGEGELAESVVRAINSVAWSGFELLGVVNDSPRALCRPDKLAELVENRAVDEVIFALPPDSRDSLQKLVFALHPLPVNLRLVPDVADLVFIRATIEDVAGLPLIGLREPAIGLFDRLIKRSFDMVLAGLLILLSAPLFLLVILLMKLDKRQTGSIFYPSQRVGEGGKIFKMYKFRTMIAGADQHETAVLQQTNRSLGLNKRPDDPRITPLGRVLRRTSLDELPQLFNVLKGDMSLVGPRPELPWLVKQYEPWQYQRFAVPQGMTGWWQVRNRGSQTVYDVRLEDDLYYIHNYSFLLDLRILWLTMGAIIRGDGAY